MIDNDTLVERMKDAPVVRVFTRRIAEHRAAGRLEHVAVYEERLGDIVSTVAHLSGREVDAGETAQIVAALVENSKG